MRTLPITAVLLAGCPSPGPSAPQLPWLTGFTSAAATDVASDGTTDRMTTWQRCDPPCAYGGMSVATSDATVLASYEQGVVVLDHEGRLVGRAAGFEPTGSADELVALAVGDTQIGSPVVVVAARIGGHRESAVWLELLRPGRHGKLDLLFAAVVETIDGGNDQQGSIAFMPGGLSYRAPGTTTTERWIFDAKAGRYLRRAATQQRDRERRVRDRLDSNAVTRRES